jgi:spermidine/putrescine transport system substrate-binding protein
MSALRPPLSPEAAALVRVMTAGLSRRRVLGGAGALGAGMVLAGCGSSAPAPTTVAGGTPSPGQDVSDTEKVVRWANFPLDLDKDDTTKKYPTLEAFAAKTGITPSYYEEIDDNASYLGTIQAQLSQGQDIARDVIVATDWMAARLVRAGGAQKLDKDKNIPNAKNLAAGLRSVDYDPGRTFSLPWQSGFTGLGYNVARYKALTGKSAMKSLDDLWDPRLRGRVEVLSEMRDTIGLIMLWQGVDPAKSFTQAQFDAAVAQVEKQLNGGQIRLVKGASYKDDLTSGDAVAVIGWSGDIFQLNAQARTASSATKADPFDFVLPESGGMLWTDNLLVPVGATHKTNAEILMNYYYDPKVAAQVAAYVNFISPVKGAQQEIRKLPGVDPGLADSVYIFPTAAELAKVHTFRSLTAREEKDFTGSFQQVLGS